jgi:glycosyltransferase involved in cell wall biosynthesis
MTEVSQLARGIVARVRRIPFLLYGILAVSLGIATYLFGILLVVPRYLFGLNQLLLPIDELIVWYSGMPVMLGVGFIMIDLFLLLGERRRREDVRFMPVDDPHVTVALTAYNDEESIGPSVRDFSEHPRVRRVIVVSNNSVDRTMEAAEAAGAIVFNELRPGYGQCVYRCWTEAMRYTDSEFIVLCEGDRTFRAYDLEKLLAYAPHADIVNGTRTVEPLRQYHTQLSTIMYYGNLFVGKLLEAKRLGRCTLTDVGTTYKLATREALTTLLPKLRPTVNLEFNAYFMDRALENGLTVVECPITFHQRVGTSKGGNVDDLRALRVGARMIFGIVFGWRLLGE